MLLGPGYGAGMTKKGTRKGRRITVRDLYPELDEEQRKEAEETLDRYLKLVLRIHARIMADPKEYARFEALTASLKESRMRIQRSNPSE